MYKFPPSPEGPQDLPVLNSSVLDQGLTIVLSPDAKRIPLPNPAWYYAAFDDLISQFGMLVHGDCSQVPADMICSMWRQCSG